MNEEESAKIEKRGLGFFVCGSKIWDLGSVDCRLLGPRHCVCVCDRKSKKVIVQE